MNHAAVAQSGKRRLFQTQEVVGSTPTCSTSRGIDDLRLPIFNRATPERRDSVNRHSAIDNRQLKGPP